MHVYKRKSRENIFLTDPSLSFVYKDFLFPRGCGSMWLVRRHWSSFLPPRLRPPLPVSTRVTGGSDSWHGKTHPIAAANHAFLSFKTASKFTLPNLLPVRRLRCSKESQRAGKDEWSTSTCWRLHFLFLGRELRDLTEIKNEQLFKNVFSPACRFVSRGFTWSRADCRY